MLGKLAMCWSAFYDGIALHRKLEQEFRVAILIGEEPGLPADVSQDTRGLVYATQSEIADYFRERRDYLEAVATLDLAIHIETLVRDDRAMRLLGTKSQTSNFGQQIVNCPTPRGQPEPAARTLMSVWIGGGAAAGKNFQLLDEALQYRNWLAHGARGVSPVNALSPFMLDQPITDFSAFVAAEP